MSRPTRPVHTNRNLEKQAIARQKEINGAASAVGARNELIAELHGLGYTHERIAKVLSEAGSPIKRSMVQKALERHSA